jgi:hydroxymethylbilane synthase
VAKAALDRLLEAKQAEFAATQTELRRFLSRCKWMVLPLRRNPSAPAQGALAIETVRGRADMGELLATLNCAETFAAVTREREILRSYGGGCHQKIGASVLRRPYGEITFLRGLTDDGQILDVSSLDASRQRPPRIDREKLWPLSAADSDWFSRERIPASVPDETSALWIVKGDAYDWSPSRDQIVWTSGVQTWKKLARRGNWINGCAESLGEQEPPNLDTLAGRKLAWLKLTHMDGYHDGTLPTLATYRLVPTDHPVDLTGKSYFFWKSGSSFEHALSLNPWIISMTHFCGPGNTVRILEKNGVQPHVFLDHAQWLREMSSE